MLPMFDPKKRTTTIMASTPGKQDIEIQAEIEVGKKKLTAKEKKKAEDIMRLAKKGSIVDLAKAIKKLGKKK